jgi:thioesterase DpgC
VTATERAGPDRLGHEIEAIYDELTDGRTRLLRVTELLAAAAERYPGLVPTRAELDEERQHLQKDKRGLEIDQGAFLAEVLAQPGPGRHLLHAMGQPGPLALAHRTAFETDGTADLGPVRVDRDGRVGTVTFQHHQYLNAEDDDSTLAMEAAVDLVLLDDRIDVGVLRGGPATHPKYAGRRIFGAGINLTHLYAGRISYAEFMMERELGVVSKMYRGFSTGSPDDVELERRQEKPFVAAVETFAIGGACQWLLVMDRVIAEAGSYFNLPARKEGIIPGSANLRLPRMVGERLARQAIFFNRPFPADSPEGRLLADEVVPAEEMDEAIARTVDELLSAGMTSLLANRRALRVAQEPIDTFRRYLSTYAIEQARCLYSPALIANLERNWDAKRRVG